MIRSIAVDDEPNALGVIMEFVRRLPDLDLVQTFTDPMKAQAWIGSARAPLELAFLDIQMSRLNGLSLAQHLPPSTRIILTTAYPDFALQGYELGVIDYLLKPFSFERFERAVQKARSFFPKTTGTADANATGRLLPGTDDFIFVRMDYKTLKVKLSEIRYIEGSGNYVTLHTQKKKVMVLQNLKEFEEYLLPYQFIRIHKSYIVSWQHIDTIERGWVGIGPDQVPVGDSYKETFNRFLNENYRQF